MKITRVWAMPNKWTFLIKPIKELVLHYAYRAKKSIDPFAGYNSPADITNDLDPQAPTDYHMPAHDFLKSQPDNAFDLGIYDPPYSLNQVVISYQSVGLQEHSGQYSRHCKDLLKTKIQSNGHVISFGWNSNGMGGNRGFEIDEILLVAHGGGHNDTIVTVETKVQGVLQ